MSATTPDIQTSANLPINTTSKIWALKANTTVPNVGDIAIKDGSHAGYVTVKAAGNQITTADNIVGVFGDITKAPTASADGWAAVEMPINGTRLWITGRALAKASLATTQMGTSVTIDISAGDVYTFDQSTTTNGVCEILPIQTDTAAIPVAGDAITGEMQVILNCTGL